MPLNIESSVINQPGLVENKDLDGNVSWKGHRVQVGPGKTLNLDNLRSGVASSFTGGFNSKQVRLNDLQGAAGRLIDVLTGEANQASLVDILAAAKAVARHGQLVQKSGRFSAVSDNASVMGEIKQSVTQALDREDASTIEKLRALKERLADGGLQQVLTGLNSVGKHSGALMKETLEWLGVQVDQKIKEWEAKQPPKDPMQELFGSGDEEHVLKVLSDKRAFSIEKLLEMKGQLNGRGPIDGKDPKKLLVRVLDQRAEEIPFKEREGKLDDMLKRMLTDLKASALDLSYDDVLKEIKQMSVQARITLGEWDDSTSFANNRVVTRVMRSFMQDVLPKMYFETEDLLLMRDRLCGGVKELEVALTKLESTDAVPGKIARKILDYMKSAFDDVLKKHHVGLSTKRKETLLQNSATNVIKELSSDRIDALVNAVRKAVLCERLVAAKGEMNAAVPDEEMLNTILGRIDVALESVPEEKKQQMLTRLESEKYTSVRTGDLANGNVTDVLVGRLLDGFAAKLKGAEVPRKETSPLPERFKDWNLGTAAKAVATALASSPDKAFAEMRLWRGVRFQLATNKLVNENFAFQPGINDFLRSAVDQLDEASKKRLVEGYDGLRKAAAEELSRPGVCVAKSESNGYLHILDRLHMLLDA